MKTGLLKKTISFLALILMLFLNQSCNVLEYDGTKDSEIIPAESYFYMIDRNTGSLVMLDHQLRELKKWDLKSQLNESSFQGMTFDGKYLWVSCAGNTDKIFQIDISTDIPLVLNSIDAPPARQGTIRGIAFDGKNLWAMNSGSSTYKTPAQLYELNPLNGSIINTYTLPCAEPRGITYSPALKDAYGLGLESAIYFTDVEKGKIFRFRMDRPYFDTLFTSPIPPRGEFTRYPVGLASDGKSFWLVNSSDVSDLLYKITSKGAVAERFELPYQDPGPIVWSTVDLRKAAPLEILSITPATGVKGNNVELEINGSGFKPVQNITLDLGSGVKVNSVTYVSFTQLKAKIAIEANATVGKRNVVLTIPGSGTITKTDAFEITQSLVTPFIWVADQFAPAIITKINLLDNTITKQFNVTDISATGPQGLAFDGNNLWMCVSGTDRKIYKLNTEGTTLTSTSSFNVPVNGGTLRGMVWEDNKIWLSVSNSTTGGKIYKLDPQSGTVLDSLKTPGKEPRGIAFANGVLYCNDTTLDSVYTYNKQTASWKGIFATPMSPGGTSSSLFATGLTFDGQGFWIANSSNDFDYLFNISLTGTVIKYIEAPRKGSAQITGIVYTLK